MLAAALCLQAGFPSYATKAGSGGVGQVDVSIGSALLLQRPVDFSVSLSGGSGRAGSEPGIVRLEPDGASEGSVRFDGLEAGAYTLTVSGKGFATYTQEIQVSDRACDVSLKTGFLGGLNYEAGASHPGVLLIGDVNGDGRVDEVDRTELVDAINRGVYVENADLNGDGAVNLVDLEYLAKGYAVTGDTRAEIISLVPAAVIESRQGEGTKVEGELSALLRDGESVRLTPRQGGSILENPVSLEFDFAGDNAQADGIIIETNNENPISKAQIVVRYLDGGGEQEVTIPVEDDVHYLLRSAQIRAERDGAGNICLHLGSQVALKKVTLTIMGMRNNNNLAEISKVEFLNGMEERIPAPEMDIPQNLSAAAGSQVIDLTWDACVNVTGYEVQIRQGGRQQVVSTAKNSISVRSFNGKELENYKEYQISVQSVNGSWRSGYGDTVTAVPKPSGRPDKPDNVSATGKYQSVQVSWKKMDDTLSYNLYYKKSAEESYQVIKGIEANSYTVENLADLTEYTFYVTGVNDFGESAPSLAVSAVTTDMNPAEMPKYNLINIGKAGEVGAHIISATTKGTMTDSSLDTQAGTAWGTVDHDPSSYYQKNTWDDGGFNNLGQNGLIYEFDQAYKLDTIALQEFVPQSMGYFYARVRYWDEDGKQVDIGRDSISVQRKTDAQGRVYYVLKLPEPVNAKKIQFGLARYLAGNIGTTISEVYFYYYDTLMDEVMALYEDDLHTVLRADVTQSVIDALRVKIHAKDEVSGEYHPDRELLEKELQTAEAILKDGKLNASVEIYSGISTKDTGRGFGGINAWQPLGVVAAAEEEIMVYVGHNSLKTGADTSLQLVATQYHAESSPMSKVVATLKVGANKVTVPKIWNTTGYESGGALYVQYTGSNANDRYAVRVSGGVQVPRLDLYRVTDAGERLSRTEAYVEALKEYTGKMENIHKEAHQGSGNKLAAYDYDSHNCILGATDIMLDTMMLSLPAQQVLNGAGSVGTREQARKILNSMDAMEDMMYLFYQHKGLNANAAAELDRIPKGHLNIRYQRMFSGAFMYASGNHIGIEWNETAGMMGATPVVSDDAGRYQSGSYFGWGIAHEIGHCINQGAYAVAEVTNNYYAQLAQAKDRNEGMRFQYGEIYKKVTSGAKGPSSNLATQLGMYWQLHLAYDRGYNYKTYENHGEQLAGLFYARVDTYARDTAKAPAPGGVKLALSGDKDQALMRLACAAAEKNILEFFERWGMTPDGDTKAYAGQFDRETRAIYYANDDARVYSLQGGVSKLSAAGTTEAVGDNVTAAVNKDIANQVDFTLGSKNIPAQDVLGYEIVRCMISGGVTNREAVGFATEGTFSDTVYVNNRVVWYEVTLVDKYLNRSAAKVLEPMKIEHDGNLDKTFWTIGTEGLTVPGETEVAAGSDSLCTPEKENLAATMIDGDSGTIYEAVCGNSAEITITFNKELTVAGFGYRLGAAASGDYEIQVLSDDKWITAAAGSFGQSQSETVCFENEDGKYVSTYGASALKLVLKGQGGRQVAIAELDVLGVTGDNVDFGRTQDSGAVIGTLKEAYRYGDQEGDVIPAGSMIFTGTYKGNPAYNVVILYDQNGEIVGGVDEEGNLVAQQIILADVPEEGDIRNVSQGTWIYWIEPEKQVNLAGSRVRAELYRVNNALTNEGQRMVSDSLAETVPESLPEITIDSSKTPENL